MSGSVIWITGLAASGKTTFMRSLAQGLTSSGLESIQLDGDELRRIFRAEHRSFDYEGRLRLGRQYSDLCGLLARQGHIVLIATIALFHEIHQKNRRDLPNYVEVLMDTPLEVVRSRDPKGVYARQSSAGSSDVVGVDWDAEIPISPDYRVPASASEYDLALRRVTEHVLRLDPHNARREDRK